MKITCLVLIFGISVDAYTSRRKSDWTVNLIGQPIRRSIRGNRLFVDPTESIRLPAMNVNLEPNIIHSCYKQIDPRTCSEFFNKMLDY